MTPLNAAPSKCLVQSQFLQLPHPLPSCKRPKLISKLAPVAQLDRALPSEGRGHRFESCRVHQLFQLNQYLNFFNFIATILKDALRTYYVCFVLILNFSSSLKATWCSSKKQRPRRFHLLGCYADLSGCIELICFSRTNPVHLNLAPGSWS